MEKRISETSSFSLLKSKNKSLLMFKSATTRNHTICELIHTLLLFTSQIKDNTRMTQRKIPFYPNPMYPNSDEDAKSDVETKSTSSYCMHTVDMEFRHVIRSTHIDKSIEAKRKVIRMLFVIILEFFVCWTPLHVINT
ncbi:hypothetical protein ACJJTC_016350, partial [Scirpophaga incertulas]